MKKLIVCMFLLGLTMNVFSLDRPREHNPAWDRMSRSDVLEKSRISPSDSEKRQMRGYLARTYPDTAEGKCAAAWLSEDNAQQIQLYRDAVALDPGLLLAWGNLGASLGDAGLYEEEVKALGHILDKDPSFDDFYHIRGSYFVIRNYIGDKVRAGAFRKTWEARLRADHWVFAEIDYGIAYNEGDWSKALAALERPIQGKPSYRFLKYTLDLSISGKLGTVSDKALMEAWEYFIIDSRRLSAPIRAKIAREYGEFLNDRLKFWDLALQTCRAAFRIYPHAEAMAAVSVNAPSYFVQEWGDFQDDVLAAIPWSWKAWDCAISAIASHIGQDSRIEEYYKKAMLFSPDEATDWTIFLHHIQDLEKMGLYDAAWALLETAKVAKKYEVDLGYYRYDNRRLAGDFSTSLVELDRLLEKKNPGQQQAYLSRRDFLLSAIEQLSRDPFIGRPIVTNGFPSASFAIDPAGDRLVLNGQPGEVRSLKSGEKIFDLGRVGYKMEISPDGNYLATISQFTRNDGVIEMGLYIYNLSDGHLAVLRPSESTSGDGLAWSPDGSKVSYVDDCGWINIFDRSNGWKLTRFRAGSMRIPGPSTWLSNNAIAVGQAQTTSVRILDAYSGKVLKELMGVDWPHALALAMGGRRLVCVDNEGTLSSWDTETWELKQMQLDQSSKRILSHPSKPYIALEFMGKENPHCSVIDISSMTMLCTSTSLRAKLRSFGDKIVHNTGDRLTYYDWESLTPQSVLKGNGLTLWDIGLHVDEDLGYAIINTGSKTQFLDLETGLVVHKEDGLVLDAKLGPGRWIGQSIKKSDAYIEYSTDDFRVIGNFELPRDSGEPDKVKDDFLLLKGIAKRMDPKQQAIGRIGIMRISEKRVLAKFEFPVNTRPILLGSLYNPMVHADISSRGDLVLARTQWQDGWGTKTIIDSVVRVFGLDGRIVNSIDVEEPIRDAWFDPASPSEILISVEAGWVYRYDAARGDFLGSEGPWLGSPVILPGNRKLDWNSGVIRANGHEARFDDNLMDVVAVPSRNLVLCLTTQGEIRILSLNELKHVLSLFLRPDTQWIAFNTTGAYASSPEGRTGVTWRADGRNFPLELSGLLENRTDILAEALKMIREEGSTLKDDTLDRIQKARVRSQAWSLTWGLPLPEKTTDCDLDVRLKVEGLSVADKDVRIMLRVNGRLLTTESLGNGLFSKEIRLVPGINVIAQLLVVDGFTLAMDQRQVFFDGAATTGTLRILGIGVSQYAKRAWNLAFASIDVSSFTQLLATRASSLFTSVDSRTITDEAVSRERLRAELRQLFDRSGPDDTVMLVFSGHGLQTLNGQGLVFLTNDADSRETGYNFKELLALMDIRPTTQRVILVLDLCHSGELSGNLADRRQSVNSEIGGAGMSRESGAIFLFSSQGYQYSLEGEQFRGGHGAFMATLMDAVEGWADGNKDGLVDMRETTSYIIPQVMLSTGGLQEPAVFIPELMNFGMASVN